MFSTFYPRRASALAMVCRGLICSFITVPAAVLLGVLMLQAFTGSLTGAFLQEARLRVADAPPGKVWICAPEHKDMEVKTQNTPAKALMPAPVVKAPCAHVLADTEVWQQSVDSLLKKTYWMLVVTGFAVWLSVTGVRRFAYREHSPAVCAGLVVAVRKPADAHGNKES